MWPNISLHVRPSLHPLTPIIIDVASQLDERGMHGFLEDCFEDGLLVAPGASSGSAYESWVRLCFTAAPPDDVRRAVRSLAKRLGRAGA